MLKKVSGVLAAIALILGAVSQTGIVKNFKNVSSFICFEHDGDGLSN